MTKRLIAIVMALILFICVFVTDAAAYRETIGKPYPETAVTVSDYSEDDYATSSGACNHAGITNRSIHQSYGEDENTSGQIVNSAVDNKEYFFEEPGGVQNSSPVRESETGEAANFFEEDKSVSDVVFEDINIEDIVVSGASNEFDTGEYVTVPLTNDNGKNVYTLTLVTNGGEITEGGWQKNSEGRYYRNTGDTGMITLPETSYEGYVLAGWAISETEGAVYDDKSTIHLENDTTLYAIWEIKQFTVTFLEEEGGRPIWSVDVDYGSFLWGTLRNMPWLTATGWVDNKVTVTLEQEQVEVTRIPSGYTQDSYYYTFRSDNKDYFTVADGVLDRVNELNQGYTFIDWYYEGYNRDIISADTFFYPRCINTNAFVANVNYQYEGRGIAAPSASYIIEFDSTAAEQTLKLEFRAKEINNYTPYISSDSNEGVTLETETDKITIGSEGNGTYSAFDGSEYTYILYIDVNEASFKKADGTIIDGEIVNNPDEADGIYYIDFQIEYRPVSTGYTVRYFGELLDSTGNEAYTDHYALYVYDEIRYSDGQWIPTRYRADTSSPLSTAVQNIRREDGSVIYYYSFTKYNIDTSYSQDIPRQGYQVGDEVQIVYPATTGFSIDMHKRWAMYTSGNSIENQEDDSTIGETTAIALLYTRDATVNLFFNRIDYYLYYVTNGGNTIERRVLAYGANVPEPDVVTRNGYVPDINKGTNGWEYHSVSYDGELIGEKGEKPDTMPAVNTFAVMNWLPSDRSYNIRLWIEEANTTSYTVQDTILIDVLSGADGSPPEVDVDDIISAIKNKNTNNIIYSYISDSLRNYGDTGYDVSGFFTFNEDLVRADYGGVTDIPSMEISADGTTVINIYYSRNVYTLEFVLARYNNGNYQVANSTNGSFGAASWMDTWSNEPPEIKVTGGNISEQNMGSYKKYTFNNSVNTAYGFYTDNHTIGGYSVAVYYIVAKYGADISKLWPVNGGEISIDESYSSAYVSMGPDGNSMYYSTHTSNRNILNIYSSMDIELLLKGNGSQMDSNITGYYDLEDNKVSHRLVSYWASNPPEFTYYYLLESPDDTYRQTDFTVWGNLISQSGADTNNVFELNDLIYDTYTGKYYKVEMSAKQNSTAEIASQNQPARMGFSSRGKLYNSNSRYVYFFYDRSRYNVDLHNVDSQYLLSNLTAEEQNYLLNMEIKDLNDQTSVTTLEKQGFDIINGELVIKYGTNLKYFADDAIKEYLTKTVGSKLAYPSPKGNKEWTFGGWYLDNECIDYKLENTNADAVNAANSNVALYAKWIPPTYTIAYHLTEGTWDRNDVWYNSGNADYVNKTVALKENTYNIYTAELGESDYMPQPVDPIADGYSFYGWFYFTGGGGNPVYLDTLISAEELSSYSAGDTYKDLNSKVWRIYSDEDGRLWYDDAERANRYLYGTETIYTDLDIYAVWERTYSDQLEIWHIMSKETADTFGVDVSNYPVYVINTVTYYLVNKEIRTQQPTGVELLIPAKYDLKADGVGGEYSLLPEAEYKRFLLNEDNNAPGEIDGNTVSIHAPAADRFCLKDNSGRYYLLYKYDLASSASYKIWFVDYDEAVKDGILKENEYFTRENPPEDYSNSRIFILQPRTLYTNLTSSQTSRVSVVGTVIPGYTLITQYQQELNLLADNNKNNIYFYYRRNASNTTYTIEFKIMNAEDNTYGNKSIKLENMPGVIGTTITAQNLADYFDQYLDDALAGEGVDGNKPIITITDENGTVTSYNLADVTLTDQQRQSIIDMLHGTARDRNRGAAYVLINNNSDANMITVYMRYGSINLKKTDEDGNPLWAKVRLERYVRDSEGNLVLDGDLGTYEFADGIIDFYGLFIDKEYVYRITEIQTQSGYSLLKEPVDITLPFMRSKDSANTQGYDYRDDEGNYYWFDLSCTVANNTLFNVPITGAKTNRIYGVGAGIGLLYISLILELKRRELFKREK